MGAFGLNPAFNQPQSNDPTQPAQQPQMPQSPMINPLPNPLQALMAQSKKKKSMRPPAALASAIARSKRARPQAYKFGG